MAVSFMSTMPKNDRLLAAHPDHETDSAAPLDSTLGHSIPRSKRNDHCRRAEPNNMNAVHPCAADLETGL